MKKYLLFYFILLFNLPFLLSQQIPIEFRHLDKTAGLDQPFPYDIIQDSKGFIWIGGENGLWRYSGSKFKHYYHSLTDSNSLAYDFVWTLFEDSKGHIWAGTYGGGLSKFDPNSNQFTNYTFRKDDSTSLSNNNIRGIEEDDQGNIWLGTNDGLNKFDPKSGKFKRFGLKDGLSDLTIRTIKQSRDQKKLFICTGNGLDIYDLKTEQFTNLGLKDGLRYSYLYDLLETDENKLWIATGGGVEILDLETMDIEHVPNQNLNGQGLSHYVTFSIYQNPSNTSRIWFATMNGINYYDCEQEKFYWLKASQKKVDNIGGDNIYDIFEDRSGGIWAAVNNGGVYHSHPGFNKFNYESFLPKDTDKYLNRYTDFIQYNEDEMLITTYSGLILWNQKTKKSHLFQMRAGDPQNINRMTQIKKLKEDEYLISTWGNFLYHWNHKNKTLKQLQYTSTSHDADFNLRMYVDKKARIWVGNSLVGLQIYDLKEQKLTPFSVSDLSNPENSGDEYVKYMTEDAYHRLWIGTADGIHLFNEIDNTFLKFEPSSKEGHLSNGNINHISPSRDKGLWISTEVGLNYFDFADSSFTRYFKKDGLPSNVISSAMEDEQGNVWVATASGLTKMTAAGTFSNYDESDGLREEYFIFGAAYQDTKGSFYFGTSRELIYFDPTNIHSSKSSPIAYFDQLNINNKLITSQSRPDKLSKALSVTDSLTLSPEDYFVNIDFDALNLLNGQKTKYSILMEGLDEAWRPASEQKSVTFSNLEPGNYKLKLRAVTAENIWSKEEASLAITVLPFWYNSIWFRAILTVALLLVLGLTISWRFNQIKKRTRTLENLVSNRTEEVLAQKEEIESQNEKLLARNNRIELLLRELNHRIKNNLQLTSSILNLHSRSTDNIDAKMALTEGKLRMQALSLLHQKLYMTEKYTEVNCKEYIKELIEYLSLAFKSNYSGVHFNLDIDDFKLNLDQAVPLGLILNELVTNSLKYSGKDKLIIDFNAKKSKEEIIISLKDNGPGITKEQFDESTSFGISMIKSLTDQINGDLLVGAKDGMHFKLRFMTVENGKEAYNNILIIEDESLIAQDLSFLLKDLGYNCIGIAKNYERAIFLYSTHDVHLILCDINIEGEKDGIETVNELSKIKQVPIIYLSAYSDDELINRTSDHNTFGYLVKPYNERSLEVAINLAFKKFYSKDQATSGNNFLSNFTIRETEIIKLLASGKSTSEIGDILFISPQTVSKHRSNILKKAGCKSSTELIHLYYQ